MTSRWGGAVSRVGSPGPGPTTGVLSQGSVWGGSAGSPTWVQEHLFPTRAATCVRPPAGPGAPVTVGLGGGDSGCGVLLWDMVRAQQDTGGQVASTCLPMSCLHPPPRTWGPSPVYLGQKAKAACFRMGGTALRTCTAKVPNIFGRRK